jgi:hypothetical protein
MTLLATSLPMPLSATARVFVLVTVAPTGFQPVKLPNFVVVPNVIVGSAIVISPVFL